MGKKLIYAKRLTLEIWGKRRSAAGLITSSKEMKSKFIHYAGSRHTKPIRSYQSGIFTIDCFSWVAVDVEGLGESSTIF